MNERNVDALEKLIWECIEDVRRNTALAGEHAVRRGLAERLAAQGVLVPSALTDRECEDIHYHSAFFDASFYPDKQRAEMERIAKGEPRPEPA